LKNGILWTIIHFNSLYEKTPCKADCHLLVAAFHGEIVKQSNENGKMTKDNVIFIRENCSVEYGDSDAWCDRGIALSELGRFDEALQVYDKAIELYPDDYNARCGKAMTLFNLNHFEEALQVFDNAIELCTVCFDSWCGKGLSLYKLGRCEEALQCYDKGLELCPDCFDAWCDKAAALRKLGRHDEALQAYDCALELCPDDYNAWYNKGYVKAQIAFKKASPEIKNES